MVQTVSSAKRRPSLRSLGIFNAGAENPHRHLGGQPSPLDELALAPDLLIRGCANGEVGKAGREE
jgi:hypothetical protein